MEVLIERVKKVTNRIEERNKQFKELIRQTEILVASKPRKIITTNGTLKIE